MAKGSFLDAPDLPELVAGASTGRAAEGEDPSLVRLPANLAWLEGRTIEAALAATGGNRTQAAALLGIHRMTLVKKLRGEPVAPTPLASPRAAKPSPKE